MSYVLVADADVDRTASCLELLSALGAAARTARSAEDAVAIVRGQGSPALLIVDLALPGTGFDVVDALPGNRHEQPSIVAWSSDEGMREYARQHLAGADAHILRGAVRFQVLQALLQRLLRKPSPADPVEEPQGAAGGPDAVMTELTHKARQLSAAAGVAVYLRTPGETKFRASVSWTSEAPIPNVPAWMPQVFGSVLETSRPLILPDLSSDPDGNLSVLASRDGIGGIVAIPVIAPPGEITGMICLFDIKPLAIGAGQIDTLRALGGAPRSGPTPVPVPVPVRAVAQPDDQVETPVFELPTTMLDRRGGATAIQRELARARREQRQLSIVLFDVDPLPSPSVTVDGSQRRMIVTASQALTKAIRESDLAIRWGQEELLVVLPGLGVGEARQVAERVRAAMQAGAIDAAVAGGVAELLPNEPFESVVVRANAKVRLARERGHNRVA
jgi:diguanylate cyclase (GGDEF)-like protein